MEKECECGRRGSEGEAEVTNTVTTGFIRKILSADDFAKYTDNDESVLRRCVALEEMLECCKFQEDTVHVPTGIHILFQDLVKHINASFKVKLPMFSGEVKK